MTVIFEILGQNALYKNKENGQAQWLTFVIPALWEAD